MVQLGSIVILLDWSARVWICQVSFLGSKNTRFQAPRFWLPLGTAALVYLVISGTILDILRLMQPLGFNVLVPAATITLDSLFLLFYLSPNFHNSIRGFITRNFFRNKYDYRDLWMKFSDKSSGSLNIRELLPKVGDFVAEGDVRSTNSLLASGSESETFISPIAMTLFMQKGRVCIAEHSIARAQRYDGKIVRVPARRSEAPQVASRSTA